MTTPRKSLFILATQEEVLSVGWNKARMEELNSFIEPISSCKVAVCAPDLLISSLATCKHLSKCVDLTNSSNKISPLLAELGVKYCLLSLKKDNRNVDSEVPLNQKLRTFLQQNIVPIICVGETHSQREFDLIEETLAYQIKSVFFGLSDEERNKCILLYQPALPTGEMHTPQQVQEQCASLRKIVRSYYGNAVSRQVTILYGGTIDNKPDYIYLSDVDGFAINNPSQDFAELFELILLHVAGIYKN